uniref:Acyl-CoA dehydrogenase n=1 Tax=Haemonchus placei TaxID=6290 RepID=A0A0N4WME0_HAEPC
LLRLGRDIGRAQLKDIGDGYAQDRMMIVACAEEADLVQPSSLNH